MNEAEAGDDFPENGADWVSIHLFHYEDLERVILGFVHPLVAELAGEDQISGFFYIRYGLGGPHVRLRLRPKEGARGRVLERTEPFAREFLSREPSKHSLDEGMIRQANEVTLKNDQHEVDASVFPDNSYHLVDFRPEIDRYGGPSLAGYSLDYFTLSSIAVLDLLPSLNGAGRATRIIRAFELLLSQALGFAADEGELIDLLRYGVDWWGTSQPEVIENGTAIAKAKKPFFLQLFGKGLEATRAAFSEQEGSALSPRHLHIRGARRLSRALESVDPRTRLRIGSSQIHMTASRLGLSNQEEAYLSQILTLILAESPEAADCCDKPCREGVDCPGAAGSVRELLPVALATLVKS